MSTLSGAMDVDVAVDVAVDDAEAKKIDLVVSQTTYTREEAAAQLAAHDGDPGRVVGEYMAPSAGGGAAAAAAAAPRTKNKYAEFRKTLKEPIRAYERDHPVNVSYVAQCFAESERRQQERAATEDLS